LQTPEFKAEQLILNALTIDVEDYYHVTGFERQIGRRTWGSYESRFEFGLAKILEALDERNIKATFYVLGWLARRHPQLIRELDAAGHELGSHSYWHRQIFRLRVNQFRADLRKSKQVIEDCIGKPVVAFRAPSFSITERSLWALEILAEEGFESDSSIFPVRHDRYGIRNANPHIHVIGTSCGAIWELPPAVHAWGPLRLPVGGGGYFRLYPHGFTTACLRRINGTMQQPFVFYVHPWEFDAEQPRVGAGSGLSRMRHYMNLHSTETKFAKLLSAFHFGRVCDVVEIAKARTQASAITPA
jgi:polysaccharide deacetylase family protein (PEP-CTERM system associated)